MAAAGVPQAEQIRWISGNASVPGNVERICPGRHIRSDQWRSEWNDEYLNYNSPHCYDYISDYECIFNYPIDDMSQPETAQRWQKLQRKKRQGTAVAITDITHFTTDPAVQAIIDDEGFRGGRKKVDERERNDVEANLSWWNPVFPPATRDRVRNHLGAVIRPFSPYDEEEYASLKQQFATSNAFKPTAPQDRRFYFKYGINELCDEYKSCFRSRELDFRILGTFGYKKEVMHAVLVCSEADGASRFRTYPRVATPTQDRDNRAVVTRDNSGTWIWKPEATAAAEIVRLQGQDAYPKYRRWDHVSFAFHIPKGGVMKVPHLEYKTLYD